MAQNNPILGFLPIIIVFLIFYFLLIRPMQKKQKELREFLKNLKKGDRIITTGGIYGTIVALEDDTVVLKVSENVKIRISRSAVAGLQPGAEKEEV
ncbi:MAG: preprotein translocase subunit YajC [Thermoanaerobaculia bacterium]